MQKYNIPTRDEDLHLRVLALLNFNLKLSNLELGMLSAMLKNNMTIVNADSKEVMRKALDKSKYMINNYIIRLRDKNIFIPIPNSKHVQIRPDLVELTRDREFSFTFDRV